MGCYCQCSMADTMNCQVNLHSTHRYILNPLESIDRTKVDKMQEFNGFKFSNQPEGDSLYPICTPCASLEESQNVDSCNQGGLLAFDLKDVGDYPIESLYSESNTEQEPSNSIDGREDSSENPEFIEWTATGSCEPEPVMEMDELDEIWETWMSEHPEHVQASESITFNDSPFRAGEIDAEAQPVVPRISTPSKRRAATAETKRNKSKKKTTRSKNGRQTNQRRQRKRKAGQKYDEAIEKVICIISINQGHVTIRYHVTAYNTYKPEVPTPDPKTSSFPPEISKQHIDRLIRVAVGRYSERDLSLKHDITSNSYIEGITLRNTKNEQTETLRWNCDTQTFQHWDELTKSFQDDGTELDKATFDAMLSYSY